MLLETCLKKSAYGMYRADGWVGNERFRLALGTERREIAQRRCTLLERAAQEGPESAIWEELKNGIPRKTFQFFAKAIGYQDQPTSAEPPRPTWTDLCDVFELEMRRLIENKNRGANSEEGVLSESTRDRYRHTIRHFTAFLADHFGGQTAFLDDIKKPTIEMFKVDRQKKIGKLKQGRGGSSTALDIAILHRMFAFAISKQMMTSKPINLQNESKPGKNPRFGARPFTAEELVKLRRAAELVNNGGELRKPTTDLEKRLQEITGGDLFILLVLRWTGLRVSDAVNLRWQNVHFDRGVNGEIEVLTQKRSKIAIVPLAGELRDALEKIYQRRKPKQSDQVLQSPENGKPFSSRQRPYERMKALARKSHQE